MSDSETVSKGGIAFAEVLAVTFITLKLCGLIAWSWWWVLSPIWIPFGIIALIVGFTLLALAFS